MADEPAEGPTPKKSAPKKAGAKKTAAKKTAAKQTAAKKTAAKKTAAKKTAAKKAPAKAAPAEKTAPTKTPVGPAATQLAPPPPEPREAAQPPSHAAPATPAATTDSTRTALAGLADDARVLTRLVDAYRRGEYREISPRKLALMAAGLAYVVSPLDVVPDFVPLGFLDDVIVLGLLLRSVKSEVDTFRRWEQRRP